MVGRAQARKVLTNDVLNQSGALGRSVFQAFKAGLRKRLNQMLREMWGPFLSAPAIPGADLRRDSVLTHLIAKM